MEDWAFSIMKYYSIDHQFNNIRNIVNPSKPCASFSLSEWMLTSYLPTWVIFISAVLSISAVKCFIGVIFLNLHSHHMWISASWEVTRFYVNFTQWLFRFCVWNPHTHGKFFADFKTNCWCLTMGLMTINWRI